MNVNNVDRVYIDVNVKVTGDFKKYQKYQYINMFWINNVIAIIIHSHKRTNELLLLQIISSNINWFRNNFMQTFFSLSQQGVRFRAWAIYVRFTVDGLKVALSHLPKKKIVSVAESPLKTMKNIYCFILKALFVLKMFKCLPWFFGHIEKNGLIWKIMLMSDFMTSQHG